MPIDHRENVHSAVAAVGKHAALILTDDECDAATDAVIEGLMDPQAASVPREFLDVWKRGLAAELALLKREREG